jgi:hypothetical protein
LEKVEEEIRERVIDCDIVVGEYKDAVDAIYSRIDGLRNIADELTYEQKESYLKQVDAYISMSNQEVNNQKKLETTNEYYLKYSELLGEQRKIVSAINDDVSKIHKLRRGTASFLEQIDSITKKYADAVSDLEDGNYDTVRNLLRTT